MEFLIKSIKTENELDKVLEFSKKKLPRASFHKTEEHSRKKWLKQMVEHGELMLFSENRNKVIGVVFGRIENGSSIIIGPIAVERRFRKKGLAKLMLLLLEKRGLHKDISHFCLGAADSVKGFNEEVDYEGNVIIRYKNEYKTQMFFKKTFEPEPPNNIGNYAQHAQFWDWSGQYRTEEFNFWRNYASKFGENVLIPMCALSEAGAYMAERGMKVTAFDITPEMVFEGKKRFGNLENLQIFEGDITNFRFDISPADFCCCSDFQHIHDFEKLKSALGCINAHLRKGGCLVIETSLPGKFSSYTPGKMFRPLSNVYPDLEVWKIGDGLEDAEKGRCYISQMFFMRDKNGEIKGFDHSFYLQSYSREMWLEALNECGFEVAAEYKNRKKEPWNKGENNWIVEAIKKGGIS